MAKKLKKVLSYVAPTAVRFYRAHLLYIVIIALIGGAIIYAIEGGGAPYAYIDCAFIVASAVTGCGLQTFDVTLVTPGSRAVIFFASLIGAVVLLSSIPASFRRHVIWRAARDALGCTTGAEPRLASYLATHLEYRALSWVRALVLGYWAGVQLAGWLALGTYLTVFPGAAALEERSQGSVWWFALFATVTSFGNVGLLPLPDGLAQFAGDYAVLLLLALMIVLGSSMYPVALRALVLLVRATPAGRKDASIDYILEHSRRVHTHLFPPIQTAAVLATNSFFIVFQWAMYAATNAGLPVYAGFPPHVQSLVSFFQAVSTRSAGFQAIDLGAISAAAQLSSFVALYVPPHPFAVSLSHPNNGAESRVGGASTSDGEGDGPATGPQLRSQRGDGARGGSVNNSLSFAKASRTPKSARAATRRGVPSILEVFRMQHHRPGSRPSVSSPTKHDLAPVGVAAATPTSKPTPVGGQQQQRLDGLLPSLGHASSTATPEFWPSVSATGTMASVSSFEGGFSVASFLRDDTLGSLEGSRRAELTKLRTALVDLAESDVLGLIIALVLLALTEAGRLFSDSDPGHHFSLFACAFELMSAYATCGISLGYPGSSFSLCAQFSTPGKLIVMGVMVAGRLRGFPHAVVSTAALPGVAAFMPLTPAAAAAVPLPQRALERGHCDGGSSNDDSVAQASRKSLKAPALPVGVASPSPQPATEIALVANATARTAGMPPTYSVIDTPISQAVVASGTGTRTGTGTANST